MASKLEAPILGGTGIVTLDPAIFGEDFNGVLVHEVVRAELAAKRRGTASTKGRGEVAMTGAKAWRQKGTGRARIGAQSAGHRRGGGVTFGPKPRSYVFKINRKVRRKALRQALSLHAQRNTIAIVDAKNYDSPSTKSAATALNSWKDTGSVVILTGGESEANTALSFRNIARVRAVLSPKQIGVSELTTAQHLVISKTALEALTALASTEVDRSSKQEFVAATRTRPLNAKALAAAGGRPSTGTPPLVQSPSAPPDSGSAPPADGAPAQTEDVSETGDTSGSGTEGIE